MTPITQTLLTLACMGAAWYWGLSQGTQRGIVLAVNFLESEGLLKDGVIVEYTEEEEEDDE